METITPTDIDNLCLNLLKQSVKNKEATLSTFPVLQQNEKHKLIGIKKIIEDTIINTISYEAEWNVIIGLITRNISLKVSNGHNVLLLHRSLTEEEKNCSNIADGAVLTVKKEKIVKIFNYLKDLYDKK